MRMITKACCVAFLGAITTVWAIEPEERLQFADGMYLRGLYDMALAEYVALRSEAPGFEKMDAVLYRMGECHRQLGDPQQADQDYRQISLQYGTSSFRAKAELRRAELYLEAERYDDAAGLLEVLVERGPPGEVEGPALYYLGYVQRRQMDRDPADADALAASAEKALRQLLDKHEDSPLFSYGCLELAALYADRDDAAADIKALYEQALEHPSSDRVAAEAWFQLGSLAYEEGDYSASAEAYESLLRSYPSDERVAESKRQAAWSYLAAGRHDDALALVARGTGEVAPAERGEWLYLQANCERKLGRRDEARRSYQELLETDPDGPHAGPAAYEMALLDFEQGRFQDVVREATHAQVEGEAREDLHWLLAESYTKLNQPAEAEEHYRAIKEHFPGNERAPLAAYRLAAIEESAGRLEEASQVFRWVAETYPRHELAPDALWSSAYCRTKLEQYDEALSDWRRLAESAGKNYARRDDAFFQQATTEYRLGRPAEATATLQVLLKDNPSTELASEAHCLLAILAEEQGDLPAAEAALRAALSESPTEDDLPGIRYRLALTLQKQDELDEAADLLESVLPDLQAEMPPSLLEWLARRRMDEARYAQAAGAAEAMAAVATGGAWQQIAWYLAGDARQYLEQVELAEQAYEKALAAGAGLREGVEAALALGGLALEQGAYDRAAEYYRQAGELVKDDAWIDLRARSYYGLGQAAKAGGHWDEAAKYFLGVGILFDDDQLTPESMYLAAEAFEHLGRVGDRDRTLTELRARYPDSQWAKKVDSGL